MPRRDEEDLVTFVTVQDLLEQQKSFCKELLDQQEKNFRSCVQVIVDSMFGRMDSLFRDVQNVTKDIQDRKSSLQFSQDVLDDMKA